MKYEKISVQHMNSLLDPMLLEGEESLCPIYCVFELRGGIFSAGENTFAGYTSCTSGGRLILVIFGADILGEYSAKAFDIATVKNIKIGKTPFGEYRIRAEFPIGQRFVKLKISATKKVYSAGCNFPDQERNLERTVEILRAYAV